MGGGKTTSSTTGDKESRQTTKMLREKVQEPLIGSLMPQWMNMMMGKISPQSLPIVQGQVGGIRSGTSSAMDAIKAMFARSGLTGTPYAARQEAETIASGEKQAASVGPDLAMEFFKLAPSMINQTSNTILANKGTTTTQTQSGGGFGEILGALIGGASMMGSSWLGKK